MAKPLPFGAHREIARRLAVRGTVRSISHISRCLSGQRKDVVVARVASELRRERWTRNIYQRVAHA